MSFASRLAGTGLLVGFLSVAPLYAQQDTTQNTTTPGGTVTQYGDRHGFDWGWLGLLGLLGLLGVRKSTNVAYQDRNRTYQDRTTNR